MSRLRFFSIVVAVEEVGVDGPSESSPMNKEELLSHSTLFPKGSFSRRSSFAVGGVG